MSSEHPPDRRCCRSRRGHDLRAATKEALIDAVLDEVFDISRTCDELATIDCSLDLEARMMAAVTVLQGRPPLQGCSSTRSGYTGDRPKTMTISAAVSRLTTSNSTLPWLRCSSRTATACDLPTERRSQRATDDYLLPYSPDPERAEAQRPGTHR